MDSTTREKKGFKWIVFLIPTTVNVWVVNRLSLYSNNMCTCIIIETWIYSDVGLKLNFSIQTIFPPLWPPLRTHVVVCVCVWWGHDTFRYDHCLECELAPAFPYWFLAQFTWFHMYLSLFACRCKYFSKCKSIKVAMSSSRACYSQLGPWSKLEHNPWRWRTRQESLWTSSTLATSLRGKQGRPTQVGGPIEFELESVSDSRNSPH